MNMRRRRKHCANILGRDTFYRYFVIGHHASVRTRMSKRKCTRVFFRESWT